MKRMLQFKKTEASYACFENDEKTYDGTPIPEGYVLASVWLKRDFVNKASYIKSENLTTRKPIKK